MSARPEWLGRFVEGVVGTVSSLTTAGEFNCHTFFNAGENEWEITVFARPVQFGGRLSGFIGYCPVAIDVFELASCFTRVRACGWQSARVDSQDDLGSHLSMEGEFDGRRIWLRIPSQVPSRLASNEKCFVVGDTLNLN